MKCTALRICLVLCLVAISGCLTLKQVGRPPAGSAGALGQANFRVLGTVETVRTAKYIFGFGARRQALYCDALQDLAKKASLTKGSRVLLDLTYDDVVLGVPPFYYTKDVYATAILAEFAGSSSEPAQAAQSQAKADLSGLSVGMVYELELSSGNRVQGLVQTKTDELVVLDTGGSKQVVRNSDIVRFRKP